MERLTFTIEEAANELGISRNLAYQLARKGELPGVRKLGGRYLVSKHALEAFFAGTGQTPKPLVIEAPEPRPKAKPKQPYTETRADNVIAALCAQHGTEDIKALPITPMDLIGIPRVGARVWQAVALRLHCAGHPAFPGPAWRYGGVSLREAF